MELPVTRRIIEALNLPDGVLRLLGRYADWLATEAERQGGIGPGEVDRLDQRHLADSLALAELFPTRFSTVLDAGTGVGLPGIPLAIAYPRTQFLLVDRSGKRIQAVRRAIRILDLHNVGTEVMDLGDVSPGFDVVVSRAAVDPTRLLPILRTHVNPGGTGIVAGSRVSPPTVDGFETVELCPGILDPPGWALRMRQPSKESS